MIHALAERIASVFISGGAAEPEDADIYTYACELFVSTAINVMVCFILSALLGRLAEGGLFTVCFAVLRHFTGGHHARHHRGCILTFACILTASLLIVSILPENVYFVVSVPLALTAMGVVFALAPVEHENKAITESNRPLLKKKSRIIAACLSAVITAGMLFKPSSLFLAMSLSIASVSGSMAYATLIKSRRSV